jgi:hypothetical protein
MSDETSLQAVYITEDTSRRMHALATYHRARAHLLFHSSFGLTRATFEAAAILEESVEELQMLIANALSAQHRGDKGWIATS